jgi:hypothetical protein
MVGEQAQLGVALRGQHEAVEKGGKTLHGR